MSANLMHIATDSPAVLARIYATFVTANYQLGCPLGPFELAQMEDVPLSEAKEAFLKLLGLGHVVRVPGTEDFLPI